MHEVKDGIVLRRVSGRRRLAGRAIPEPRSTSGTGWQRRRLSTARRSSRLCALTMEVSGMSEAQRNEGPIDRIVWRVAEAWRKWRLRRYWTQARQVEHLRTMLIADHRWLAADRTADALTERYPSGAIAGLVQPASRGHGTGRLGLVPDQGLRPRALTPNSNWASNRRKTLRRNLSKPIRIRLRICLCETDSSIRRCRRGRASSPEPAAAAAS